MYEVERYVDANDRGTACLLQGLLRCQRPVRVVQTFSEAMVTCRRHAIRCKVKTGVKKDGTLVATGMSPRRVFS